MGRWGDKGKESFSELVKLRVKSKAPDRIFQSREWRDAIYKKLVFLYNAES